ncbi:intraflagellar transport related protein, particle [Cyclospora cayetanensis]|uniref:Intraflagellar transport related protein, particle n=1 Tax=Cyclospora cayetanensis TaxID=88456 RepID=A0A1D3D0H3_9EIME|nr:intraflagellar transport related protein, particle [Cyclospora cayetanensis]
MFGAARNVPRLSEAFEETNANAMHADEALEHPSEAHANSTILKAARLLATCGEAQPDTAYERIASALQQHGFDDLAEEVQLERAMRWLRGGQVDPAIAAYKAFKSRRSSLALRSATNLSFIFLLEGDIEQAATYAGMAVEADRGSARALVNKACTLSQRKELDDAAKLFEDAAALDSRCPEAFYNLAVTLHKLGRNTEALDALRRLRELAPDHAEALFHAATIYEEASSKKLRPWDLDSTSWIGVNLVKSSSYREAFDYFSLASQLQPSAGKWRLMAAFCLRKSGQLHAALTLYESLYKEFPGDENVQSGLKRIRTALGLQAD